MNNFDDVIKSLNLEEEVKNKVLAAQKEAEKKAIADKKAKEAGRKDALTKIEALKKEAMSKISEAEKIADDYGLSFSFSLEYGMGGTYYPNVDIDDRDPEEWYSSNTGWQSSSANC